MNSGITSLWLGRVDYRAAWQLQRELVSARADGRVGDTLLLLEHPPTITLGRAYDPAHVLANPGRLAELGISVVETDRGGDVTYHGPGQLVGYPIVLLDGPKRDLHAYLRGIEGALIAVLHNFGVIARRNPPHTGVWIGERKIAAIGIKVSRWVTQHGFALNLNPDLSHFRLIVPCGIHEFGVTRLCDEMEFAPTTQTVLPHVAREIACALGVHASARMICLDTVSQSARNLLESAKIVHWADDPSLSNPATGLEA